MLISPGNLLNYTQRNDKCFAANLLSSFRLWIQQIDFIIPLFTYGILVWGVASYDKYLSKIGKFQGRVFRFGFIKGAPAHFKPSRAKGLRQEVMD